MSVKRGGLGRSLSALLQASDGVRVLPEVSASDTALMHVPITALHPGQYQPRRAMDESALAELALSIKKQGLLQPLVVRSVSSGQYEIVAGERRWRACQLAGMQDIPVLVRQIDDETAMAMALVENLQREALSAIDQARAMFRLTQEFALTHQEIANLLSKSRASVTNFLRLLQLNPAVQVKLERGDLDMGHARCLLMLDEVTQSEVADWVVSKQLSVRETEALVSRLNSQRLAVPPNKHGNDAWTLFQNELNALAERLKTKVSIKSNKSGKGTLIIHYADTDTLRELIQQFNQPAEQLS